MSDAVCSAASGGRSKRRFSASLREPPVHMDSPAAPANPTCLTEAFLRFEGDVTEGVSASVRSRRGVRFEIGGGGFLAF